MMYSVSILLKPASGLCNMHCDYCFYCDEIHKREQALYGFMSEQTLKNVIRKTLLKTTGDYTLAFQGGEPTLCGLTFYRQVIQYVKQYNRNHAAVHYVLQTNGYALNEAWASFFAENHFLIGVSVDGSQMIHDQYRHAGGGRCTEDTGDGTYDRVMESIRCLEKYHVDYNILTVVHKKTAEHIKEIYREYQRKGWKYLQFITCLDPLDEKRGMKDYSLLPSMYGQFLIDLFELWCKDFKKNRAPYIRQFENYIGILLGYPAEACDQKGCCGLQYVVEADGSVYPCDFYVLDEWKLGNLNTDRMQKLDEKRISLQFIERSQNHPDSCRECRWLALCRGGCYRSRMTAADAKQGAVEGQNYFCEGYKKFFETCSEQMQEIAEYCSDQKII